MTIDIFKKSASDESQEPVSAPGELRAHESERDETHVVPFETQINQKSVDMMLAEIRALCLDIDIDFDLNVHCVSNDSKSPLYASHLNLDLGILDPDIGIVEVSANADSKKEVEKSIILQLYMKLRNNGALDIYRKRLSQQSMCSQIRLAIIYSPLMRHIYHLSQ